MLDIHGIVPEENKLINKNFRYLIFNFCERIVFTKEKLKGIYLLMQLCLCAYANLCFVKLTIAAHF